MSDRQIVQTLEAALATFCLHIESRIAAVLGRGFYTIGPCGEEALSAAAHCLQPQDSLALHYRHYGINLCRQLVAAASAPENDSATMMYQLLLDRARGYTVSRHDPVTGGVHCSIGSSSTPPSEDYIVTSTLASQCPAAVGRALGYALLKDNNNDNKPHRTAQHPRAVSMVTLGDGSVHNHHFWSAFHLARHARHRNVKCPVIFGISDNGLSISYNPHGYVETLFDHDPLVPLFRANGNDMMQVYDQTLRAVQYARQQSAPAVVLYQNLTRRFGHAATDRQAAYLDEERIQSMADCDLLERTIAQAVQVRSATTYRWVRDRYQEIRNQTVRAFAEASAEAKVTREDMVNVVSAPLARVAVSSLLPNVLVNDKDDGSGDESAVSSSSKRAKTKREVMRKHITRVLAEVMREDESVVYLGEDVKHGGYYAVTEGLAEEFPGRILDFPPDETSLLGAAMGFSQIGLTPCVEIPYAKYLDCGADMFHEIAVMHWLSAGKRPNGMVIRLQGFDRGLFGGNFHTSNVLSIPPGVDVCCYSNGEDYVRGFRNAICQAKAGRVVMSVDCTNLLNLRHLHNKDRGWERSYPAKNNKTDLVSFDFVRRYGTQGSNAIIAYGNGVVAALQARQQLVAMGALTSVDDLDVIDCPYLSSTPQGLKDTISQYRDGKILFADICKEGPSGCVLSNMVCSLRSEGILPHHWELVSAPRTYNPLGNMSTFLNEDDIVSAFKTLLGVTTPHR